MLNNRMIQRYELEAKRLQNGNKHLITEPAEANLQTALDKYRLHQLKSKATQRK